MIAEMTSVPLKADVNVAQSLLEQIGGPELSEITRMPTGSNNRTYHLIAGDRQVVLKIYFTHPDDPRDRLENETAFSAYATGVGCAALPALLAKDIARHAAMFEYVDGDHLNSMDIDVDKVDQAIRFISALNPKGGHLPILPKASESCHGWAAHVGIVRSRLHSLQNITADDALVFQMQEFVDTLIAPYFDMLVAAAETAGIKQSAPGSKCVSPSDFGFHNALLRSDSSLCFLDFEYGGIDDPFKMVADFFCQTKVAVPFQYYNRFRDGIRDCLQMQPVSDDVFDYYLSLYQVKWMCIVLNAFNRIDHMRRTFAAGNDSDMRAAQLERARVTWARWTDEARLNV